MTDFKKTGVLAVLLATVACSAMADDGRGYGQHRQHRHPQVRQGNSDWVAPLLFLGLAGVVLSAAANQPSAPAPAPTYVVPPQSYYAPPVVTYIAPPMAAPAPPAAPANVWYYCQSVGKYYPYTQYCPEGWQMVAPSPQ